MRSKERIALLVLAMCLAAGALTIVGIPIMQNAYRGFILTGYSKECDRTYHMGDTVVLDAEAEKDPHSDAWLLFPEVDYTVGLPFGAGRMTVRVIDAELFDDPVGAGIADDDPCLLDTGFFEEPEVSEEGLAFLRIRVAVKNIDAEPKTETRVGRRLFLLPDLLTTSPRGDEVYFDGMPADAGDGEMNYFGLAPGQECVFTIGYALDTGGVDIRDISLSAGRKNLSRYRIELSIEDGRSGAAS